MIRPIPTYRSWPYRLLDRLRAHWHERARLRVLRDLDRRTLVDIGIDPSEVSSIEAESKARAALTRLRIVAVGFHA